MGMQYVRFFSTFLSYRREHDADPGHHPGRHHDPSPETVLSKVHQRGMDQEQKVECAQCPDQNEL